MPLVALLDDNRVEAMAYTADSWAALKASPDRNRLVMPLCGIRAVAKTRGETRFFAHYTGCAVDHGGESPQHLAMKAALAAAINAVPGWHAVVEHAHPDREWIIDVLAGSNDGRRGVAFEVQLSAQTPEKFAYRSQRYFDSGLFPVWIVPRPIDYGYPAEPDVPAVVTGFSKTSELPDAPDDLLQLEVEKNFRTDGGTLADFVGALLTSGPGWKHGSPKMQREARAAAHARAMAMAETERRTKLERIAKAEQAIQETNRYSAAPAQAFGEHLVRTDGPYVWAT